MNDINTRLINLYIEIKTNPEKLFNLYESIELEFNSKIPASALGLKLNKNKDELKTLLSEANNFYLEKRNELNSLDKNLNVGSALLLFVLKHNFNGIYRENKSGNINSPFNWSSTIINLPEIKSKIKNLSNLLNILDVEFSNLNIKDFILEKKKFDFNKTLFYYDPPYINNIENTENNYSG